MKCKLLFYETNQKYYLPLPATTYIHYKLLHLVQFSTISNAKTSLLHSLMTTQSTSWASLELDPHRETLSNNAEYLQDAIL